MLVCAFVCVFYVTEEVRVIRNRVCLWDNGKWREKRARQTVAGSPSKFFFFFCKDLSKYKKLNAESNIGFIRRFINPRCSRVYGHFCKIFFFLPQPHKRCFIHRYFFILQVRHIIYAFIEIPSVC